MPARLGTFNPANAMPVALGGTGSTTAGGALANLGGAPSSTIPATAAQLLAAFLDVSNPNGFAPGGGGGFQAYPLPSVNSDAGANFNASTSTYTVRFTGLYQMVTKLRPADNAYMSFGHAPDTALRDSPNFVWALGVGNRLVSVNVRFARLVAGDQIQMVYYADSSNPSFVAANMAISLVSVG